MVDMEVVYGAGSVGKAVSAAVMGKDSDSGGGYLSYGWR